MTGPNMFLITAAQILNSGLVTTPREVPAERVDLVDRFHAAGREVETKADRFYLDKISEGAQVEITEGPTITAGARALVAAAWSRPGMTSCRHLNEKPAEDRIDAATLHMGPSMACCSICKPPEFNRVALGLCHFCLRPITGAGGGEILFAVALVTVQGLACAECHGAIPKVIVG